MEEGDSPSARDKKQVPASVRSRVAVIRRKKVLIGGAIALAFLLFGVGAFWFGSKQAKPDSITDESVATDSAGVLEEKEATVSPTTEPTDSEITPSPKPSPTPTGEPEPTATPTPTTKTFDSSADLDGFQSSNGGGNKTLDVRTGRNIFLVTRGFVSFGIGDVPEGATIEKATLRLYQAKIIGNPYGAGVRVKVDHLDYGSSFENGDYSASSISGSFATLSEDNDVEWKEVDVTDQVRDDLANGRERSQFRIHLAVENIGGDATGDFAKFESANNSEGTGNTPKLVVVYR